MTHCSKKDLIVQVKSFLSGGTTLEKFTEWIKKQQFEQDNRLSTTVLSDLGSIALGEMNEKGLRKAWSRMLNKELYG